MAYYYSAVYNDARSIAEYSHNNPDPAGNWREWVVDIELPFADDRQRLLTAKSKAITRAKQRTRRKSPASPLRKSLIFTTRNETGAL